jgi:hypothetical protein
MGSGQSAENDAQNSTNQAVIEATQAVDDAAQVEEAKRKAEEARAATAAAETEKQKEEARRRQEEAKKLQEEAEATAKASLEKANEAAKVAREKEEMARKIAREEEANAKAEAEAARKEKIEQSSSPIAREARKSENQDKPKSKAKLELFNIHMSLTNLLQYISFSSPLLLIFFITLYSIIQNNYISGLIFNMGIVIISSIVYILKHVLKNKQQSNANPFCNVLPAPFSVRAYDENIGPHYYDSPSFSSAVLSFSATYLIYPMVINNQHNVGLLVVSIVLVLINAVTEFLYKCSGLFGITLGILLGIIVALLYYSLLMSSDYSSQYTFFTDSISNNIQCSKPGTQNFKCKLYKNGEAIGQI